MYLIIIYKIPVSFWQFWRTESTFSPITSSLFSVSLNDISSRLLASSNDKSLFIVIILLQGRNKIINHNLTTSKESHLFDTVDWIYTLKFS